ncbi:MAG: hypothetical protein IPM29_15035 [Planctomycetes bacterium]|nr:hypothetical protein [Planctomycetota bacterium]
MAPTPLPTKKQFQKDTAHSNKLKLRGTIARIDTALHAWHALRSVQTTVQVYKECRHWLKAKEGKTSSNSLRRQTKIKYLVDQALVWIQHLDPNLGQALLRFNEKKAGGAHAGAKPLAGVYQHERSLYVQSGKTHAPSGTMLDARFNSAQFGGKAFGDLTEAEFAQLDRQLGQKFPVVYLPKMDRLQRLVFVQDHRLITFDGSPLTTQGEGGWPYAIDRYGNLFTTDDRAVDGQFNHSSFNAGNDVICAGMIRAQNGQLLGLSNNSGHYKPSQQHLHNAVVLLMRELGGTGTRTAKAELWDFVEEPGYINIYEFPFAGFPAQGHGGGAKVHRMRAP